MGKASINLPTIEECHAFWDQYVTPQNIRRHMQQVARVAVYLAKALNKNGQYVIVDLVERAALLHDTVRVTDWDTLSFEYFDAPPTRQEIAVWESQRQQFPQSLPHAEVNFRIFNNQYPEMAHLILLHSIGSVTQLHTWEEKLLNYADRRVAHDRIVTLQERLDEAYVRYSKTSHTPLEKDPNILAALARIEHDITSIIHQDLNSLPL